jgi:cytoskeletal protein CcmA (bactofilin family)
VWRKEEANPQTSPEVPPSSMNSTTSGKAGTSSPGSLPVSSNASACVSQGIKIRGEVTGTEDLFVDGVVDGKITLTNSTLTVGPNAAVKAEISSRDLVVRGRAEGKFTTTARIQIWHTARVHGEIRCGSISIEDGAELSGKVEAGSATGSAAAGEFPGHSKKGEGSKAKDASTKDTTATPGAATAGAD